jgi:zinc ribbon protein
VASTGEERRCPRCGTPYGDGQEYCLECGQRLPATSGLLAVLGSAWRRRLGWYPGDWIWPALAALMLAAAAGVVSALWLAERSSSANETVVETSPRASSVEETTAPEPTVTTTTTATATTGTTRTAPPPPPPPPKVPVAWPAGKSGWTIVLDSVPSVNGRAAALAEARQALHVGMKQVGVLDSSRFSSLHPGYFVVFSGIYDTQAQAQSHIIEAHRRGYRGPYPRRITP